MENDRRRVFGNSNAMTRGKGDQTNPNLESQVVFTMILRRQPRNLFWLSVGFRKFSTNVLPRPPARPSPRLYVFLVLAWTRPRHTRRCWELYFGVTVGLRVRDGARSLWVEANQSVSKERKNSPPSYVVDKTGKNRPLQNFQTKKYILHKTSPVKLSSSVAADNHDCIG